MATETKLLNEEQIELGAMFLAASNTGLIGCGHQPPTNKKQIRQVYQQISGDYYLELGEGLDDELKMWKKDLEKIQSDDESFYKILKEKVPFIFE